jgi:molybdenum cofactor cytidylyltransferase
VRFGPVPLAEAEGAILAHSVRAGDTRLRKGLLLDAGHLAALGAAGIAQVTVARLGTDDVHEDMAAERLARALVPDAAHLGRSAAFTGRVNLLADGPGVAVLDAPAIHAVNAVHPMITVATVPNYQQMGAGGMVATVKIIAYAVPEDALVRAEGAARGAMRLAPVRLRSAGLVVTEVPGGPPAGKGARVTEGRIAALGMALAETRTVPHETGALSRALAEVDGDMVLILTGSATSDPGDVGPAALALAGGRVERFGMPVDPGNLLFTGTLGARPVIGLPGCARSPALNGADWVLSRIACGIAVGDADIAAMGVGGLLKEIPTRPQPRDRRK